MLKLAPCEDSPPKENLQPGQEARQSKAAVASGADVAALPDAIMAQLRLAAGNLEGTRQRVASSVLGPSHNLPTRSLAQQVGRTMLAHSAGASLSCSHLDAAQCILTCTFECMIALLNSVGGLLSEIKQALMS